MQSRPGISPLTPADQTEIAHALPTGGPAGIAHHTHLAIQGRRICVTSVLRPGPDDGQAAFSDVATRRAEAGADRLLPVLATGCHDGCFWIAYEYGAATPLASEGWRKWQVPAALDLLSGVGCALDDAASQAVLAHELGPGSIFLDPRVGPLLGDFGSAREAFGNPPFEQEGTAAFVPPEVATLGRAGARSGVYAAGALLYALLSGGPPRPEPVTHWRTDLPEDINLVLARAMARDSLERYRTAAELCDSARRALAGGTAFIEEWKPRRSAPVAPAPVEPALEAAAPAEPASAEPAPFRRPKIDPGPPLQIELAANDYDWAPPEPPFARALRAGVVVAAVAIAAFAGTQFGRSDTPAGGAGSELVGNGVSITLPKGWSAGIPRGDNILAAYPNQDWFSGLSVELSEKSVAAGDRSDPVRLGQIDMWRDRTSAPELVRYTAPTTAGTLIVSCEVASEVAAGTLRVCERAISTLQLEGARPLPLSGVVREPGVRAAVTRLGRARKAGRSRLARARAPRQQRAVAGALARAYEQAARRFAQAPESADAAVAARRAAQAYRQLARAAGNDSARGWTAAAASVRRAEADLTKQLSTAV